MDDDAPLDITVGEFRGDVRRALMDGAEQGMKTAMARVDDALERAEVVEARGILASVCEALEGDVAEMVAAWGIDWESE